MATPTSTAADAISRSYDGYVQRFGELTREARGHFERGDWQAAMRDAVRRLDLYSGARREALAELQLVLGEAITDRTTWMNVRTTFAKTIAGRSDVELAETFFNSVTRRVFQTVGVDPSVEFVARTTPGGASKGVVSQIFFRTSSVEDLMRRVLEHYDFACGYTDLAGDAERVAQRLIEEVGDAEVEGLELVRCVFFRSKAAYLVGKLRRPSGQAMPFVLSLRNPTGKVTVDALLLDENEVSILFSFARAYFAVEMEAPGELIAFLRTIMPRKPPAELYNAVGCNRHGKTELFRSILRHLEAGEDNFVVAPGQRGMVMACFALPGIDVVFKVIRDRFGYSKSMTRADVVDKYRLVFRHDRAGRLVDAQEFEHVAFARERFSPEVLDELMSSAKETAHEEGERVVISHLYAERRLRPLDLYLRESEPEMARQAVIDYGQALRDLAANNVFPGDLLLKNFGVSRHGRVIFYDYDELCPLSECNFRRMPAATSDSEEMAGEPWFYVGEHDIFPEEFRPFLGLTGELWDTFAAHHAELLTVDFWQRMQDLHKRGEMPDLFPYPSTRRLRPVRSAAPE